MSDFFLQDDSFSAPAPAAQVADTDPNDFFNTAASPASAQPAYEPPQAAQVYSMDQQNDFGFDAAPAETQQQDAADFFGGGAVQQQQQYEAPVFQQEQQQAIPVQQYAPPVMVAAAPSPLAATPVSAAPVVQEKNALREWEAAHEQELLQRAKEEDVSKKAAREAAKNELAEFYENRKQGIERRKNENRLGGSKATKGDEATPGEENPWKRVVYLTDVHKAGEPRDISRMKQLFNSLKETNLPAA